ncbi:hypothetical protein IW252_002613 [Zhihengliuella flava]|uniref:Uncharacterized protein n=1 Tax=Zhihengliuella flava TaxID=1285193 RepID=A0A931DE14_9MICC|nr:hypothetical protein [Zhihengliuella flava]MBG6085846.1 hypothetical protein [Zhihengliuella flava]
MTVSGVAYELPTWEHRTAGSASSSSESEGELFLTPVAAEGTKPSNTMGVARRQGTGQAFLTNQIVSLCGLDPSEKLLKTPTSQLAVNGGSQHPDKRREGGHGPTLADEVEHLLPTPCAQPSGNAPENHLWKKPGRTQVTDLAIMAENGLIETGGKLLPTPTVGMTQGGNRTRSGDRSDELLLNGAAEAIAEGKLFPTPRATDGTKGGPNQRGSSGELMLPSAVQLLPTPVCTDANGARNATADRTPGKKFNTGTTLTDALVPPSNGGHTAQLFVDGKPCEEPPQPLQN